MVFCSSATVKPPIRSRNCGINSLTVNQHTEQKLPFKASRMKQRLRLNSAGGKNIAAESASRSRRKLTSDRHNGHSPPALFFTCREGEMFQNLCKKGETIPTGITENHLVFRRTRGPQNPASFRGGCISGRSVPATFHSLQITL